jgi:hypothetical protein
MIIAIFLLQHCQFVRLLAGKKVVEKKEIVKKKPSSKKKKKVQDVIDDDFEELDDIDMEYKVSRDET